MCQLTRCSLVALHANSCSSEEHTLAKTARYSVLAAGLIGSWKLQQNKNIKNTLTCSNTVGENEFL